MPSIPDPRLDQILPLPLRFRRDLALLVKYAPGPSSLARVRLLPSLAAVRRPVRLRSGAPARCKRGLPLLRFVRVTERLPPVQTIAPIRRRDARAPLGIRLAIRLHVAYRRVRSNLRTALFQPRLVHFDLEFGTGLRSHDFD